VNGEGRSMKGIFVAYLKIFYWNPLEETKHTEIELQ
jgi:hypothetical protein